MAMDIDTHPNPTPNLHHRKIELQSLADLTHLQTQLHAASTQKLDLHFPPSALRKVAEPATYIGLGGASQPQPTYTQPPNNTEAEVDPMRQRVQTLVDSFLQRTWESASHSISINGLDATSLPNINNQQPDQQPSTTPQAHEGAEIEGLHFTYTPYDSRLQSHLASLYGELESLTAQVSKLRREAPSSGAQQYSNALNESLNREEEKYEAEMRQLRESDTKGKKKDDANTLHLSTTRDGYYTDLRDTYEHGLRNLSMLTGTKSRTLSEPQPVAQGAGAGSGVSLTETVGKVQRARTVAMEFD
jgi:hypothetical protein